MPSTVLAPLLRAAMACCIALACQAALGKEGLRLGWQVPWATQGQLVMGLKKTNIQQLTGQKIRFVEFSYAPPLSSAALAGQVDILLTSDQPAIVLLSRAPSFRIVARMMYNRACVYVPRQSSIGRLSDLAGGTVMGPVGAAAERVAMDSLRRAGVDTGGIKHGLLDMSQQAALMRRAGAERAWPGIDALYGFDPIAAAFEETGRVRMLDCGRITAVVMASGDVVSRRSAELQRFLSGFMLSWHFFASNPGRVNAWYVKDARLDVSHAALDMSASVEPNRSARSLSDIRLDFTDEDRANLRDVARYLHARGTVEHPIDPARFIDLSALRALRPADLASLALEVRPQH